MTLVLVLAMACRCTAEPPPPAPSPHFAAWAPFAEAAARGDVEAARLHAAALGEDERGSGAGRAASMGKLGAAVGFVRFAEDGEELADAVASTAAACGACHQADGVHGPPRPEWGHHSGADWALWGLVWADPVAPPEGGEAEVATLSAAFASGADDQARAAGVVARCAACHRD